MAAQIFIDSSVRLLDNVLGGGVLFGAVFMITDPVTTPLTIPGRIIFAVATAALTLILRWKANLPDGVLFSILLMNMLTPAIDRFINGNQIKEKGKKYIKYHNDCRQILNGSINNGYYTRPKCLYDIATLIINNKDDIQNLGQIKITDLEDFIFDLDNITNKDIKKLDWVH